MEGVEDGEEVDQDSNGTDALVEGEDRVGLRPRPAPAVVRLVRLFQSGLLHGGALHGRDIGAPPGEWDDE